VREVRALPLLLLLTSCLDAPPSSVRDGGGPPPDDGGSGELVACDEPADCPDTGPERECHCGSCAVRDPACAPSAFRWVRDDGKQGACAPVPDDIALGYQSTCIRWSDGRVSCWGGDCFGEVGDGGAIDCGDTVQLSLVPSLVRTSTGGPPLEDVLSVSAGSHHVCARRADGSVWCWGDNSLGKLGAGSAEVSVSTPVQVVTEFDAPLSGIVAIATGNQHTCALDGQGFVHCWGDNGFRQLGVSGVSERNVAILSGIGTDFAQIAAGGWHSCVSRPAALDDELFCWGRGSFGQLGDGVLHEPGSDDALLVTYESEPGVAVAPTVFGLGENFSCSATAGPAAAWCWGSNVGHALGDVPAPASQNGTDATSARAFSLALTSAPTHLAGGTSFACMRLEDGSVTCWGTNSAGQLGIGQVTALPQGPTVLDLEAVDIEVGDDHACAITPERTVVCWGGNTQGQLGNGGTTRSPDPVEVLSLCQ
jgi:alpha-tubulin suppressor-like RCC1 family protein